MNIEDIKQIPLIDFLAALGHQPEKIAGKEYWYKSPFRKENTASFSVNIQKNVWIDFGTGEGGGIFQLAEKIYNEHSIARLISLIKNVARGPFSILEPDFSKNTANHSPISIIKVLDISHPNLVDYLKKRSIDLKVAKLYCKEVHYLIDQNSYYAIGFENNSGGWELRNPNIKNGMAPKDITHLKSNYTTSQLTIFEGFFDFLSFKQLQASGRLSPGIDPLEKLLKENSDYLILNSTAFLKKSLPLIRQYPKANLFLDNDLTGHSAASTITSSVEKAVNYAVLYPDCKDMNDWLIQQRALEKSTNQILEEDIRPKRYRGLGR
ncbi:toprim domain-containing protein [Niabella insulamsoli]|uniref:toprim domain-containing protein n=1 Tax=Niabella insulamsoli TaxID=3144874 RepID=UPI0031FD4205